jgi:hypothetical protein
VTGTFDEVVQNPAWDALILTVESYLGNHKKTNYGQSPVYNTPLRMQVPHPHLDFFPVILADVSDENSEGFHQGISTTDKCCQGKQNLTTTGSLKQKLKICIKENTVEKNILNAYNLNIIIFSISVS